MNKTLLISCLGFVFMAIWAIPAAAQPKLLKGLYPGDIPTISELENQYGSLEPTDEFMVALEIAQMEQALQEEDSTGFAERFSDEDEEKLEYDPLQTIIEFMGYFIRVMRTRTITSASGEHITGTFDFTIRDLDLQRQGNHINLFAMVKFSYLMIDDSTQVPMTSPVQAKFHLRHKRWKIKHAQGLFEFFSACIERLSPGEAIPEKYRRLASDFRYPATQTSRREGRK